MGWTRTALFQALAVTLFVFLILICENQYWRLALGVFATAFVILRAMDPELIWRRTGLTLVWASIAPSGVEGALHLLGIPSLASPVSAMFKIELLGVPSIAFLLVGTLLLILDGLSYRWRHNCGSQFQSTSPRQKLGLRPAPQNPSRMVLFGDLHIRGDGNAPISIYGAQIDDPWLSRILRRAKVSREVGFVIASPDIQGAFEAPSGGQPVTLANAESIAARVEIEIWDPIRGWLSKPRSKVGWVHRLMKWALGREIVAIIRVETNDADPRVTVFADCQNA